MSKSNTPKWDKFCEVATAISSAKEHIRKQQNYVMNAIQTDMNTPGKDNTNAILESETDLEKLLEIVQPIINGIEKIKAEPEQNSE